MAETELQVYYYGDYLKKLPHYKSIVKACLWKQIHELLEELYSEVGEETFLLSTNLQMGTLTHQGTDGARRFLQGREAIKKDFISFCKEHSVHQKTNTKSTSQQKRTRKATTLQQESTRKSTKQRMATSNDTETPTADDTVQDNVEETSDQPTPAKLPRKSPPATQNKKATGDDDNTVQDNVEISDEPPPSKLPRESPPATPGLNKTETVPGDNVKEISDQPATAKQPRKSSPATQDLNETDPPTGDEYDTVQENVETSDEPPPSKLPRKSSPATPDLNEPETVTEDNDDIVQDNAEEISDQSTPAKQSRKAFLASLSLNESSAASGDDDAKDEVENVSDRPSPAKQKQPTETTPEPTDLEETKTATGDATDKDTVEQDSGQTSQSELPSEITPATLEDTETTTEDKNVKDKTNKSSDQTISPSTNLDASQTGTEDEIIQVERPSDQPVPAKETTKTTPATESLLDTNIDTGDEIDKHKVEQSSDKPPPAEQATKTTPATKHLLDTNTASGSDIVKDIADKLSDQPTTTKLPKKTTPVTTNFDTNTNISSGRFSTINDGTKTATGEVNAKDKVEKPSDQTSTAELPIKTVPTTESTGNSATATAHNCLIIDPRSFQERKQGAAIKRQKQKQEKAEKQLLKPLKPIKGSRASAKKDKTVGINVQVVGIYDDSERFNLNSLSDPAKQQDRPQLTPQHDALLKELRNIIDVAKQAPLGAPSTQQPEKTTLVSSQLPAQTTPTTTQLPDNTTQVATQLQGPVTTQLQGKANPVTTQLAGQTTPVMTQKVLKITPLATQLPGTTTLVKPQLPVFKIPFTTRLQGKTTILTPQFSGVTTPITTQLQGKTTAVTTQLPGKTTPVTAKPSGMTAPASSVQGGTQVTKPATIKPPAKPSPACLVLAQQPLITDSDITGTAITENSDQAPPQFTSQQQGKTTPIITSHAGAPRVIGHVVSADLNKQTCSGNVLAQLPKTPIAISTMKDGKRTVIGSGILKYSEKHGYCRLESLNPISDTNQQVTSETPKDVTTTQSTVIDKPEGISTESTVNKDTLTEVKREAVPVEAKGSSESIDSVHGKEVQPEAGSRNNTAMDLNPSDPQPSSILWFDQSSTKSKKKKQHRGKGPVPALGTSDQDQGQDMPPPPPEPDSLPPEPAHTQPVPYPHKSKWHTKSTQSDEYDDCQQSVEPEPLPDLGTETQTQTVPQQPQAGYQDQEGPQNEPHAGSQSQVQAEYQPEIRGPQHPVPPPGTVQLFLGNFPHGTRESDLRILLEPFGVTDLTMMNGRMKSRSTYAFATCCDRAHAENAIATMDQGIFRGRRLTLALANPDSQVPPPPPPPAMPTGGKTRAGTVSTYPSGAGVSSPLVTSRLTPQESRQKRQKRPRPARPKVKKILTCTICGKTNFDHPLTLARHKKSHIRPMWVSLGELNEDEGEEDKEGGAGGQAEVDAAEVGEEEELGDDLDYDYGQEGEETPAKGDQAPSESSTSEHTAAPAKSKYIRKAPPPCVVCGRAFSQLQHLERHLDAHIRRRTTQLRERRRPGLVTEDWETNGEEMCDKAHLQLDFLNSTKKSSLSVEDRVNIIKEYESGDYSQPQLARKYNRNVNTIKIILQQRRAFKFKHEGKDLPMNSRKGIPQPKRPFKFKQHCKYNKINKLLYEWLCKAIKNKESVTMKMIQMKARSIAKEVNDPRFTASPGWLYAFKKRYKIITPSTNRKGNSTGEAQGTKNSVKSKATSGKSRQQTPWAAITSFTAETGEVYTASRLTTTGQDEANNFSVSDVGSLDTNSAVIVSKVGTNFSTLVTSSYSALANKDGNDPRVITVRKAAAAPTARSVGNVGYSPMQRSLINTVQQPSAASSSGNVTYAQSLGGVNVANTQGYSAMELGVASEMSEGIGRGQMGEAHAGTSMGDSDIIVVQWEDVSTSPDETLCPVGAVSSGFACQDNSLRDRCI